MKKEEVKDLIREHFALRKRTESLQEELRGLENRYEQVGELLYGYRSKKFIQSVLHCLTDLEKEYGGNIHYDDFLSSLIEILKNYEEYDENRSYFTQKELLHLFDEEVE